MSHSTARVLAAQRSAFTDEHRATARSGLGRASIGLDECTPAQAQLRALLALGWFNLGLLSAPGFDWPLGSTLNYGTVLSPRYDHLVLIVSAALNVSDQLVASPPWSGIPGMRLERVVGWETVLLRHLPTGASLEVTELSQPKVPKLTGRLIRHRDMLMVDQLVTPAEQGKLDSIPPMSEAARRLLGALAMRSTLRDPAGGWHVNWYHNTLGRPRDRRNQAERRLWGRDDLWFLEWTSYPYPQDLVAAMTHPVGGLDGVAAQQAGPTWILTYKGAQLHLYDREASVW
ncbi:hypothetical protein ABT093_01795 [Kitasatospora sp. NPDC002551]|uniref:hypothetical protein n=1 Tax=Kitasatospora sp. NPDC002551 TaxID=3154539 RepID=UPI00331A1A37